MLKVQPLPPSQRKFLLSDAELTVFASAGRDLSSKTDFEQFGHFIKDANEILGYAQKLEEERHWNSDNQREQSIARLDRLRLLAKAQIQRGIKAAA